jgi:tetratricopeptide (TPR) repeat protein
LTAEQLALKAKGMASLSFLSFSMGDTLKSGTEAEQAIPLLRAIDDKWSLSLVLTFLAGAKMQAGEMNAAIGLTDEMLKLAEELDDPYVWGIVLGGVSMIEAYAQGDFVKAFATRDKAEAKMRDHGNRWSYGITLYRSGNMYITNNQFELAREKLSLAMEAMQEIGSQRTITMIKSEFAHALRYEGNYSQAVSAYQETLKEWYRMGHRSAVAHQLESIAFIAKAIGQTDKSVKLLGVAETLRKKIEIDMTVQERAEYDNEVADLKASMGEREFTSLWTEGCSMKLVEAIQLALGE